MLQACLVLTMVLAADCFHHSISEMSIQKHDIKLKSKLCSSHYPPILRGKSNRKRIFASILQTEDNVEKPRFAAEGGKIADYNKGGDASSQRPFLRISQRLRKPSGAPSVVPEYSRPERLAPHDVSALSRAIRAGGAALIAVDVSVEDGFIDLAAFAAEQAAAAGFPPPCPVFARLRAGPGTPSDARRAADAGAAGLFVPAPAAAAAGPATLRETAAAAAGLGLAVIVEVSDESQARDITPPRYPPQPAPALSPSPVTQPGEPGELSFSATISPAARTAT
jgi:hypothetical protein